MNYRHIYHAGNFADVFKHIMLTLAIDYLRQKEKPFFALDTHAGIGLYDLQSAEARKTGEYEQGIGRLWEGTDIPDEAAGYLSLVRNLNRGKNLRFYPGSPVIIREMLRNGDRAVLNEKHPEDYRALRKNLGRDARLRVENMDGYTVMKSALPPHERRGLVLCDPPFEVTNEFELMAQGLKEGYKRWATGIYMMWYPVKDAREVRKFHAVLAAAGIPDIAVMEFLRQPAAESVFSGSGLAIVNPPWTLADKARKIGGWLVEALTEGKGRFEILEIAGEGK